MRPRMVAVRILVVQFFGELEIRGEGGGDPSLLEVVDRLLAVLESSSEGAEESSGLRVGVAGSSVGFPDVSITSPIGGELASEDMFDSLCVGSGNEAVS